MTLWEDVQLLQELSEVCRKLIRRNELAGFPGLPRLRRALHDADMCVCSVNLDPEHKEWEVRMTLDELRESMFRVA